MKNSKGLGVIRIGDKTSHGGQVMTASNTFKVLGKAVALEGCLTQCPQCKGVFPIQPSASERHHHSMAVAYDGDQTACGAKLISSI
jgi:uncharacterized Zn-binding protein involved in type VI secretion